MISSVLALALAATAAQADAANAARNSYMDCMRGFMRTALEQRMETGAFETALAGQCTDHAQRLRAALIARDQRFGGSREAAEEDARITIEDVRANTLENYRDRRENGEAPN